MGVWSNDYDKTTGIAGLHYLSIALGSTGETKSIRFLYFIFSLLQSVVSSGPGL